MSLPADKKNYYNTFSRFDTVPECSTSSHLDMQ